MWPACWRSLLTTSASVPTCVDVACQRVIDIRIAVGDDDDRGGPG